MRRQTTPYHTTCLTTLLQPDEPTDEGVNEVRVPVPLTTHYLFRLEERGGLGAPGGGSPPDPGILGLVLRHKKTIII